MLPDRKGEKLRLKVSKRIKYNDISTGEGRYNDMHENSLYEVEWPDGKLGQLIDSIIA